MIYNCICVRFLYNYICVYKAEYINYFVYLSFRMDTSVDNSSDYYNEGSMENNTVNMTGIVDYDWMIMMFNTSRALWRYVTPLLMFPGTIGNVVCIITLQTKSFRGSATAFLLTALAVVDTVSLLVGALHIWLIHVAALEVSTMNDPACRIHSFLTYLSVQMSAWTLVLVTLERVVSVTWPMEAPTLCSRRRLIGMWGVILFILAAVDAFIFLVNMQLKHFDESSSAYNRKECAVRPNISAALETVLPKFRMWSDLILSSLLPAALIFCGNALVMYKLAKIASRKKRMQNRNRNESDVKRRNAKRQSSKITVMLITVCATFLLTSLPINIFMMGENHWFADRQENLMVLARRELTFTILSLLYYVNNAINFALYFASGPMFRSAAINLFCPCWIQRQANGASARSKTTHIKAETTL